MLGCDRVVLLDTCCVLTLYASRRMRHMLEVLPFTFGVATRAKSDARFVRGADDNGNDELDEVDLGDLTASGLLTVYEPETDDEIANYVAFATRLGDGEAMTCGIAVARGFDIAMDDRAAIQLVQSVAPGTICHTTPDLVEQWASLASVPARTLSGILTDIRERARYRPPNDHPLLEWWQDMGGPL